MNRLVGSAILLAAGALAGCGRPADPIVTPLLDESTVPDVLTEVERLEPPSTASGNRFLRGWGPWNREDGRWLRSRSRDLRLEIVNLGERPRTLLLGVEILEEGSGGTIGVSVAGRHLESVPLANPIQVVLPADLPLGRVPVDLRLPDGARLAASGAAVLNPLPTGSVDLATEGAEQSGASLIDLVRPASGGRLRGTFVPPQAPEPGQRFSVLVERAPLERVASFEWSPGSGEAPFDLDLPLPEEGFVRIRLLAQGNGPAGHWRGLTVHQPPQASAEPDALESQSLSLPEPPKLVLVYVLDALRADAVCHLGGCDGTTPVIDRLASEGITFERHLSTAPNTLPATKALFTGQPYVEKGGWKLPENGAATLAEIFTAAGYRTASFSGNGYVSDTYGTVRGFEHWDGSVFFEEGGAFNDNAAVVHEAALRWLDDVAAEESVFLYLHTIHPHNPYAPPPDLRARFVADTPGSIDGSTQTLLDLQHARIQTTRDDEDRLRALYAAGLAYNDRELAALLATLDRRYPPGEALVVLTADHGEELFDHGGVLHGYTLLEEQIHIPLVFWWPGNLPPARISAPSSTLDVHETLRALLGAEPSRRGSGRSLWPLLLENRSQTSERVLFAAAASVKGGIFMARSTNRKLIWAPRADDQWGLGIGHGRTRDGEYVFDLALDPEERTNLAGEDDFEVAWLRGRLMAWIERGRTQSADDELPQMDEATRRRLEALGYIDRGD